MMVLERPRTPTPPAAAPPAGGCDTHVHVFGPYDRFPLAQAPSYPPPDAPISVVRGALATLGLDRAVLIQPAPYGTDNRALVDALASDRDALRGVAVVDDGVGEAELAGLHAAGVRGARFIEMRVPTTGERYAGSVGVARLAALAPAFTRLGWHAQVWGTPAQCAAAADACADLGVPLVFDHLAGTDAKADPRASEWRGLIDHLKAGRVWIKLSVCRAAWAVADYGVARPIHDALVAANPGRLLWGTDFPFVRKGADAPDAGKLLDLFHDWVGDAATARRILVDNPATLYGW